MVYSLDSDRYIDTIPHKHDYDLWRSRLTANEYDAIMEDLCARIEADEIVTSSWIPGADWTGTVFEPIYRTVCRQDFDASARFFGLLVWEAVLNHPDVWSFGRYEKDSVPIKGLTYFKLRTPPRRQSDMRSENAAHPCPQLNTKYNPS
jgi:hypothetical protein